MPFARAGEFTCVFSGWAGALVLEQRANLLPDFERFGRIRFADPSRRMAPVFSFALFTSPDSIATSAARAVDFVPAFLPLLKRMH
jgi:hypothetical protein